MHVAPLEDSKNPEFQLYCQECVDSRQKPTFECLVCQWCKNMEPLDVNERYPSLNCASNEATVSDYLYQSLLNEKTCLHGSTNFKKLASSDFIFLLFSLNEVQGACRYWLAFLSTFSFIKSSAPLNLTQTSDIKLLWTKFWGIFLRNNSCSRARMLCWVGALLGGIGGLFIDQTKLRFGLYPVFYDDHHFTSISAFNSSAKMFGSLKDGSNGKFDDIRFQKVNRRVHRLIQKRSGDVNLRCCCEDYESLSDSTSYHVIETCLPQLPDTVMMNNTTDEVGQAFVRKCRESWSAYKGKFTWFLLCIKITLNIFFIMFLIISVILWCRRKFLNGLSASVSYVAFFQKLKLLETCVTTSLFDFFLGLILGQCKSKDTSNI